MLLVEGMWAICEVKPQIKEPQPSYLTWCDRPKRQGESGGSQMVTSGANGQNRQVKTGSVSRTDQWMGECLKNQNGIALYTLMKPTFLAYFPEQSPIRLDSNQERCTLFESETVPDSLVS